MMWFAVVMEKEKEERKRTKQRQLTDRVGETYAIGDWAIHFLGDGGCDGCEVFVRA